MKLLCIYKLVLVNFALWSYPSFPSSEGCVFPKGLVPDRFLDHRKKQYHRFLKIQDLWRNYEERLAVCNFCTVLYGFIIVGLNL